MNTRAETSSSRLAWRLLILLWAALMVGATGAKAEPAKTLVQDTLYRADGSVAHGSITIRWDGFSSIDGEAVPAGEKSWVTNTNGVIMIPLIPNVGATPVGGYYKVVIKLDDGTTSEERWVVPAAVSTTVSAIRAQVVSQSVAAQFVHLTGPDSIQGRKNFLVSPEVPDPTEAEGVANKKYVDQQLSGLATVASTGNYDDLSNKPVGPVGGSYLPLVGGSLTGPLNGSVGTFSGTVAAGTTVSAIDSVTRNTPVADIRSFGAKCDGATDDTAALQAAITAIKSKGGKIGTFGNCYFANPAQLVWGNGNSILIEGQGSWSVGTTFNIPNHVHIVAGGGGGGVQFQSRPLFSINGKNTVGTLGTATVVGTATFTPSSMTGIVPGASISVAGNQTCAISGIARTSNKVTASLRASCRTPAGTQVTIAGVTDISFNGSFLATQSDYGKNTISWQQTSSNGSSSGGTLVGVNERSLESVVITATTSTTATATFLHAHSSADLFGIVVIAALNKLSGFSMQNVSVGGCGGSCIWLEYSANFDLDNVGAMAGAWITSVPLEITTSWWATVERSVFLNNTYPGSPSQPWGIRFDEITGVDSTGMLAIRDTTVGGGIKIDSNGLSKTQMASQVAFDRLIVERPVTAAIVFDPSGGPATMGMLSVRDLMLQDNFSGYSPCTVVYTDYSGGKGGLNYSQDIGLGTTCVAGGYFDGTMNAVTREGSTLPSNPSAPVGVWNTGRTLEADIRGSGAGMSPQLIIYPTLAVPDPTAWTTGSCTVTQGITAPDGSSTAVNLAYGTAGWQNIYQPNLTTNTGDYLVYGAWVKPGSLNGYALGYDGRPFYIHSYGAADIFLSSNSNESNSAPRFQSYFKGDWWSPVVAVDQLKVGDGGSHPYSLRMGCPVAGMQAWGLFLIKLPASTPIEEVQRLRQQLLHGYVPPSMPGGQILAMNPNHKLYWGNDTNLYRGAAGVLKTDGVINAVGGLQVNGVPVAGGSSVQVLDFKTDAAPSGATGSNPWTYMLPASAHTLQIVVMSAGGGGGSGGVAATGGNTFGGGGGQGGCAQVYTVPASYFGGAGTSITVMVGVGGAGGVAVSGSGTAVTGNNGSGGTRSYIVGSNGVVIATGYSVGANAGSGGSTASGAGSTNGCAMANLPGSLGVAGSLTAGVTATDTTAPKGGGGGAGGGGISGSGTVASAGGNSGNGATVQELRMATPSATTGGVAPGGAGQTPTIVTSEPMVFGALGGTGGASSTGGNGGAGGAGMVPGGGGAGGGASVPGFSSGAGGAGGSGMVRIIVQ